MSVYRAVRRGGSEPRDFLPPLFPPLFPLPAAPRAGRRYRGGRRTVPKRRQKSRRKAGSMMRGGCSPPSFFLFVCGRRAMLVLRYSRACRREIEALLGCGRQACAAWRAGPEALSLPPLTFFLLFVWRVRHERTSRRCLAGDGRARR